MSFKTLLFAAGALVPAVAFAQSEPLEKSGDQLRCELSDDCDVDAAAAAAEEAPTRSWSFGNKSAVSKSTTPSYSSTVTQPARKDRPARISAPSTMKRTPGLRRSSVAINFGVNSANLTDQGRRQADELYKAVNSPGLATKRYLVVGHTDSSGSAHRNLQLSRQRAQALVDYLVAKGLPRDNFRSEGYGETQPLPGVAASSPLNRRVEIVKLD